MIQFLCCLIALSIYSLIFDIAAQAPCEQNKSRTFILQNEIKGPCTTYEARDKISIKPGFINGQSRIIDFVWNYSSSLSSNWLPYIVLNTPMSTNMFIGTNYGKPEYIALFQNYTQYLNSHMGTGWTAQFINNLDNDNTVTIRVKRFENFSYGNGNANSTSEYQPFIAKNSSFIARINQNLVFDVNYLTGTSIPDANTRELDKSLVPGSVTGQASVSPSGAGTYSIPIDVPPGLGNMVPQISIEYNSQSGNGLLGWGWNPSGLSSITRVAKTIYNDGAIKGVEMNAQDIYALDGNRLVRHSGVYGSDQAVYRTELETFTNIISHGNNNGPEWFEVQNKSGIKYYYGQNSTSEGGRLYYNYTGGNAVATWLIDYSKDPLGNFIVYSYEQEGSIKYLKKISYGCNENSTLQNYNTVEFYYEHRPDLVYLNYGNLHGSMNRILNQIVVKSGEEVFRRYKFEYTNYNNSDPFSRLVEVTESDGLGNEYNPLIINWGLHSSDIVSQNTVFPLSAIGDKQSFSSGDFNGDGKTDYIYNCFSYGEDVNVATGKFELSSKQKQFWLYSYFSNFTNNELNFINSVDNNQHPYIDVSYNVPENSKYQDVFPCRLTGTFKQDAVLPYIKLGYNQTNKATFYKLNLGSRFGPGTIIGEELTLETKGINPSYSTADINNDGYDEILLLENQQATDNATFPGRIYLPATNQWLEFDFYRPYYINGELTREIDAFNDYFRFYFSDYNTDGLLDILIARSGWCWILINKGCDGINGLPSFEKVYIEGLYGLFSCFDPGDFNGDGLQDFLLCQRNSSTWFLAINDGNLGFTKIPISNITLDQFDDTDCYKKKHQTIVTDFNNDGKTDIIIADADGGEIDVQWFQSTGTGMIQKYSVHRDNFNNFLKITSGDFNGDGRHDILNFGHNLLNSSQINFYCYYSPDLNRNSGLVSCISNGLDSKINFQYKLLTDNSVYTINASPVFPLINFSQPLSVVSEISMDNGRGSEQNTIQYKYENALLHIQGKGFLGFTKITKADIVSKIKTISYFNPATDIDATYFTIKKNTVDVYSFDDTSEKQISKTESTFGNELYSGKHIFYHPLTSTSKDYLTNILNTKTYTYDGNIGSAPYTGKGNLIKEYNTLGDENNYISTEYKEFVNAGSFIENVPKLIETTRKNSDNPVYVSKVRFVYDLEKGYVKNKTEHEELETSKRIVTTYTHHLQYGTVLSESTTYPDKSYNESTGLLTNISKTVATSFTYTPDGRFLETKTNPMGFITKYEYDAFGNLLTEISPASFIKRYEYANPFRSLSRTMNNDGTWAKVESDWDGPNKPVDGAYFTKVTASSSAPIIKYCDKLGRLLRTETKDFLNREVFSDSYYNSKGQLEWQTLPYFSGEPVKNYFTYDDYGRIKSKYFDVNEQTIVYQYDNETPSTKIKTIFPGEDRFEEKTTNVWGDIELVSDAKSNDVSYTYYSNGLPSVITAAGVNISMAYDEYNFQTELNDPSAGKRSFVYNSIGRLCMQKDEKSQMNTLAFRYDDLGRIVYKYIGNQTVTYIYDTKIKGALSSVTYSNGTSTEYFYDSNNGRLSGQKDIINGKEFNTAYEYDGDGKLIKTTYPSGFIVLNEYDEFGYGTLVKIKQQDGTNIWTATGANAQGGISTFTMGNNKHYVTRSFTKFGEVKQITVPGLIDYEYDYYTDTRDIKWRKNHTKNLIENFTYDELDRLKTWGTGSEYLVDYTGVKIDKKNDAATGNFDYQVGNFRLESLPGAVEEIQAPENIDYNEFNKISHIDDYAAETTTGYSMDITYNAGEERKMVVIKKDNSATLLTRYYACGNYEQEERGTSVRKIDYIAGASAIHVNNGGQDTIYYIHTDNQGSWVAISNNRNSTVKEQAFDPWGRRRNPSTWALSNSITGFPFSRGYTGHEHMNVFGLINMNGRVYDPVIGLFLSPDKYIQAPDLALNYNRYAYCLNNPLKYTDPSGDFFWMTFLNMAAQAGFTNFLSQATQGNINSFGDALSSFSIGTIGGIAKQGLSCFTSVPGALGGALSGGITGGLIGGITGGLSSMANGQSFYKGFWPGALNGGIIGTVSGAISGYNRAKILGANEWTGTINHEFKLNSDAITALSEAVSESIPDGYLDCLIREQFGYGVGDWDINKITSNETPSGYILKEGLLYDKEGNGIGGVARCRVFGKTSIYLSPLVASHRIARLAVGGHELVHAWDDYYNYSFRTIFTHNFYTEHNAYSFSVNYISSVDSKYQDQFLQQTYLVAIEMLHRYSFSKYSVPPFFYKTWKP